MDRFESMRTFVAIVDQGSLTAAAEVLEKSQPSVVRTLAALEAHLGVVLLQRTTRRMSLTPEGRDFLARARRILGDVEEAEMVLGAAGGVARGHLRLSAPVEFGQMHVAPLLPAFLDAHPEVAVDLVLLDRVVDMLEEGIDLTVRIGPLSDSTMVAVPIGEVGRTLCASPALLDRLGRPAESDALPRLPAIHVQNRPRTQVTLREGDRERQIPLEGRLGCSSVAASVAACVAGAGVAQFLSYQVHAHIEAGRLEEVLPDRAPAPWPVSLVYPTGRLMTTRQRRLVDHLRDGLRRVEAVQPFRGAA